MRFLLYCGLIILPLAAGAHEEDRNGQLELEFLMLSARIEALEMENKEIKNLLAAIGQQRQQKSSDEGNSALDGPKVKLKGDFRYRYEQIDLDGTESRERTRIRARANLATRISDDMEIGVGISTGGNFPTSSTQTLGNGGSKKSLDLDLAYLEWMPRDGLHVLAGKFRNHLYRVPSQILLWDDEWRPEGIGIQYDGQSFFASFLGTWLESDSLAPDREWAAGAHAGIYRQLGGTKLTAGAGYFDFGTAGKGTFYGPDLAFAGNSFSCADAADTESCRYVNDYREVEAFASLDFGNKNHPTKIYGHFVKNLEADRLDSGWTVGARFRTRAIVRPLQLDYFYRHLEADAVYGQLTDSDFGGGGTDVEGHYFKAGWSVTPQLVLSATYYHNQVGADSGDERDYDRLQLNADFNY